MERDAYDLIWFEATAAREVELAAARSEYNRAVARAESVFAEMLSKRVTERLFSEKEGK